MTIKEPTKQFEVEFSKEDKETLIKTISLLNHLLSGMYENDCDLIDTLRDTYGYQYIDSIMETLSDLKDSTRIIIMKQE